MYETRPSCSSDPYSRSKNENSSDDDGCGGGDGSSDAVVADAVVAVVVIKEDDGETRGDVKLGLGRQGGERGGGVGSIKGM